MVANTSSAVASITNNHADCQIEVLASQANLALLFVNANSGEGYLTVDGNWGDRNNLTLWGGGNELIEKVASICNNPIVIMHNTGPVLTSSFHENPNVTAILWSAPAGEQSGTPVVDVLYGLYNYSGKPPFTMAERRSDYGAEVLYEPNNGDGAPQQDISGLDSDYRHFDMLNITSIYEFGFGLSYTTFEYSVSPSLRSRLCRTSPRAAAPSPLPLSRRIQSILATSVHRDISFRATSRNNLHSSTPISTLRTSPSPRGIETMADRAMSGSRRTIHPQILSIFIPLVAHRAGILCFGFRFTTCQRQFRILESEWGAKWHSYTFR
jgi:Glycosyl hydrolase family 3 C-terminal domain